MPNNLDQSVFPELVGTTCADDDADDQAVAPPDDVADASAYALAELVLPGTYAPQLLAEAPAEALADEPVYDELGKYELGLYDVPTVPKF